MKGGASRLLIDYRAGRREYDPYWGKLCPTVFAALLVMALAGHIVKRWVQTTGLRVCALHNWLRSYLMAAQK
jgi:hypothetical protein